MEAKKPKRGPVTMGEARDVNNGSRWVAAMLVHRMADHNATMGFPRKPLLFLIPRSRVAPVWFSYSSCMELFRRFRFSFRHFLPGWVSSTCLYCFKRKVCFWFGS